jgi:uncharacterized membrane protein
MAHPLFILAVLALNVAISEWLARHTALRHLGSALLVIVLTSIVANVGIIPAYSGEIGIYGGIFEYVAPLAIFLLLLRVHLRGLMRVGLPMLVLFLLGALGTMAGVLAGMAVVGGSHVFGELHYALGGMFVGTYTGGSINFNAVALEYGVVENGSLYAGAAVVDSAATTVWMAATVALPRLLAGIWRRVPGTAASEFVGSVAVDHDEETEAASPTELAILLALGALVLWFSDLSVGWLRAQTGVALPSILVLTTLALILAQLPAVQRMRGARVTGWFAVMIFLAVIGALCDLAALRGIGELGVQLTVFVAVVVTVHGLLVFVAAWLLRFDPTMAAVASQANIGGSTSALALARSLGRGDLALPAILIGALGNALGTYLGFMTAAWLR